MVYDHAVKVNGEYYSAGEEVPEENSLKKELPFSDADIELETEPVKRGRPRKSS